VYDPVFYRYLAVYDPAFYQYLVVYDPAFYRYLAVYAMGWYILNWTVSVMMMAATAPTSFGLEPSAAMNWSA
jgi:hypothetical protein